MDRISKQKRSKIMSAIHSKNTRPELTLRKALFSRGLRYRIHYGKEMIDIAFPARRVAVFVDGCFWHGCPIHSHIPESNRMYWAPKLKKNIERDAVRSEQLRIKGWQVVRFWEHELNDIDSVLKRIRDSLGVDG